nr:MAG TPA: hypothetical protein [Caudoviricetes sp.]
MSTRKRPFEWLFLIQDFPTFSVGKLGCRDFLFL